MLLTVDLIVACSAVVSSAGTVIMVVSHYY